MLHGWTSHDLTTSTYALKPGEACLLDAAVGGVGLPTCEIVIFFFSSRRRHTRCSRDWSSDVCSSDLVREKERGTLEQLFVTPVRPMGLLLGKLLPYLGIGFFELSMILGFMRFVFRVPIHGNVLLLAFLSLPYLFVSLSLGILISSKANTQAEAMQLAFLTILPSVFFSGYIFPRETIPAVLYPISYFIPATYFINIARGIILRGAGLVHLWADGLALFVLGTVLLILAARRFHNKVIMA